MIATLRLADSDDGFMSREPASSTKMRRVCGIVLDMKMENNVVEGLPFAGKI
jgi:hypothetical protein